MTHPQTNFPPSLCVRAASVRRFLKKNIATGSTLAIAMVEIFILRMSVCFACQRRPNLNIVYFSYHNETLAGVGVGGGSVNFSNCWLCTWAPGLVHCKLLWLTDVMTCCCSPAAWVSVMVHSIIIAVCMDSECITAVSRTYPLSSFPTDHDNLLV